MSLTELMADLQRPERNSGKDFGGEACKGNIAVIGVSGAGVSVPYHKPIRVPFELFQALVVLIGIF